MALLLRKCDVCRDGAVARKIQAVGKENGTRARAFVHPDHAAALVDEQHSSGISVFCIHMLAPCAGSRRRSSPDRGEGSSRTSGTGPGRIGAPRLGQVVTGAASLDRDPLAREGRQG